MYKNVEIELVRNEMTKGELAQQIGVAMSTMSLKLNGKAGISMKEAIQIKKILKTEMPLEELFKEDLVNDDKEIA